MIYMKNTSRAVPQKYVPQLTPACLEILRKFVLAWSFKQFEEQLFEKCIVGCPSYISYRPRIFDVLDEIIISRGILTLCIFFNVMYAPSIIKYMYSMWLANRSALLKYVCCLL